MGSKVTLDLLEVLRFIKLGLQNGNIEAAIGLVDDIIEDLEERKKEKDGDDYKEHRINGED